MVSEVVIKINVVHDNILTPSDKKEISEALKRGIETSFITSSNVESWEVERVDVSKF